MKSYTSKSNAKRAAKKELGKDAVELVNYNLTHKAGKWTWEKIEVKKAKKEKIEILNKSVVENPCALVWNIAEGMPGARRKDVIAACVKAGVAFYTARTQYQQWRTASNN